jgi:hypothetical protein
LELELCPGCGVPKIITSEHLWSNNGDILHSRAQSTRIIFLETENLDPLFRGIERIIGMPIMHMVITASRRAYRIYLNAFVPESIREKIQRKEIDYGPFDAAFRDVAGLNGCGRYEEVSRRYEQDEDDYDTVIISEPFCVPMTISAHLGAIECLTGVDQGYNYEEVSNGVYKITSFPSPHLEELKERLWFEPYQHRVGDLELERCATCGGPEPLAGYQWLPDRGKIINKITRRRMSISGNALIDPVFLELEDELGDIIPRAVVEAQRCFTKGGFYTMDDIAEEGDFRTQLALRGLGNLKELTMKREGMHMRLDNTALPLIVIGLAQGFFEMGFGIDESDVDWEIKEDGVLEMEVKPGS